MNYRVLIVIKDGWWSDQKPFQSFAKAQNHRRDIAARWDTSDTAILAPDGRVLAFRESLQEQKVIADFCERSEERMKAGR